MRLQRILIATVLLTASVAFAQASGTVIINGTVAEAASIRFQSASPIGAASPTNPLPVAPATTDAVLDTTIDMGDIAPTAGNDGVAQGATVKLIARSNANYSLSAQVGGLVGFGAALGDLRLVDFGFGVQNLVASGNTNLVNTVGQTIAAAYDHDSLQTGVDGDGLPVYDSTLADIAAPVVLVSGPRISKAGGLFNPNNGLLVDTHYSLVPQYFTATPAFSATVTWTISTP